MCIKEVRNKKRWFAKNRANTSFFICNDEKIRKTWYNRTVMIKEYHWYKK